MPEFDVDERDGVELDFRSNDGINVSLLWYPWVGALIVSVHDEKTGDSFDLEVGPSFALDAFRHPYAYQARDPRALVAH
jgi:hypothetical protein